MQDDIENHLGYKWLTATSRNTPDGIVREIKRMTRRIFNSEEKIRIPLTGVITFQNFFWPGLVFREFDGG